jgi:hypothetical protein
MVGMVISPGNPDDTRATQNARHHLRGEPEKFVMGDLQYFVHRESFESFPQPACYLRPRQRAVRARRLHVHYMNALDVHDMNALAS